MLFGREQGGCVNKRGSKALKCNYLKVLANGVYLGMVCQYNCWLSKKEANTQTMLDWVRYKNSCQMNKEGKKGSTKDKHILMPFCSDAEIN